MSAVHHLHAGKKEMEEPGSWGTIVSRNIVINDKVTLNIQVAIKTGKHISEN